MLLPAVGQTFEIIYGDPRYMNNGGMYHEYILNDSLPDGEWSVYYAKNVKNRRPGNEKRMDKYYDAIKNRGPIILKATIVDYKFHGSYIIYQHGVIPSLIEMNYNKGVMHGKRVSWNEEQLLHIEDFNQGTKVGEYNFDNSILYNWKKWYSNGTLKSTGSGGPYVFNSKELNGPKRGKWRFYSEAGTITKEDLWDNGTLLKTKEYDKSGKLINTIEHKTENH